MKIVAVIPAYNVAKSLGKLVLDLRKALPDVTVIVVDDGSTDGTSAVARRLPVHYLAHPQNQGKGAALQSGFARALHLNTDYILTLDGDGQHDPLQAPQLVEVARRRGLDLVVGSRNYHLGNMPFHRYVSNRLTSFLISVRTRTRIRDSQSGYRLIRADILRAVKLSLRHFDLESELLIKASLAGYRIGETPVSTIYASSSSSAMRIIDVFRFVKLYWRTLFWKPYRNNLEM